MANSLTCEPASMFGPKEQTIFLGASIQSVSCSLGWNEQQSSITVMLVEDNCTAPADNPKVYYPLPGQRLTTTAKDPGFIKPTIGTAVYFRIGGDLGTSTDIFEFSGIVQAWTVDASSSGSPVYTVTIVDPRMILSNLEVIVSDYAGAVGDVYNLINAYGWLESVGVSCPQTAVNGSLFGSPAGGFGGADNNNEGTPYLLLRNAIQRLLSGYKDASFAPYGYASYRAPDSTSDVASDGRPYGVVFSNEDTTDSALQAAGGSKAVGNYYVDLSEIPFAPTFYRIPGPSISVLDLVSQICADSGCDYYIELLISSTGSKCIKVRVAQRAVQPELGSIEQFVSDTVNVVSKNVGRELRNEPCQGFVYGGYVQTMYQQSRTTTKSAGEIIQFWGYDSARNLTVADNTSLTGREKGDWKIYLDVRPLSLNMNTPITGEAIPSYSSYGEHYLEIHEKEIRMAIAGYDEWFNYAVAYNAGEGTKFGQWIRNNLEIKGPNIHFPDFTGMGMGADALSAVLTNMLGYNLAFQPDQDPTDTRNDDLKKIHKFIQDWAETYYGKQFLVQLPYVCFRTDSDSGQVLYSDQPTNDGGWPALNTTNVLGLPCTTEGQAQEPLTNFIDESNKILPFCRFYQSGTGAIAQQGDWIVHNPEASLDGGGGNSIYLKGSVEEKPLQYGSYATALFKLDNPVVLSGLENDLAGIVPNFGGLVETAIINGESSGNVDILRGGLQFNADGTRGSDGTLAIAVKRRTPDEVAVPMQSNTVRYGPVFRKGPPGQVHFVADDSLVPWEYDGYQKLSDGTINAMDEKIKEALTYMQEGERGSINFPGTPTRRLGSELKSQANVMNSLSLQAQTFNAGGTSYNYKSIPSTAWDGGFGPNITNMTINFGDGGFTTSYTLSTFTPSFGKFAKYNANRLSKMGKRAQEVRKIQRERNKLAKTLKAAEDRANAARKAQKERSKQFAQNGNTIKGGQVIAGPNTAGSNLTAISNVSSMTPRTLALGNSTNWLHMGGVSEDALLSPIQRHHEGICTGSLLPRYTLPVETRAVSGNPSQSFHINPPFNGLDSLDTIIISGDYLDPFATVGTAKHDANPNESGNHTNATIVFHGQVPPGPMALEAYKNHTGSFPECLRPMAHKGPLMLHGWGYDLQGKPIPNEADSDAQASGGVFESANLKDSFLSHYLRKPHTWPVAPVDLRFDRDRGVWSTPIQYKIVQAKNTGSDIAPGTKGRQVQLLDVGVAANPVYRADGTVADGHNVTVTNPDWNTSTIATDESFFAVYDSIYDTYWPILGGSGGSALCIFDSGVCMDSDDAGCSGAINECFGEQSTLILGKGITGVYATIPSGESTGCCSGSEANEGIKEGLQLDVRLPMWTADDTKTAGTSVTCASKWEQIRFPENQFDLYEGNSDGCDYVVVSGLFPKLQDTMTEACDDFFGPWPSCSGFSCLKIGSGLSLYPNGGGGADTDIFTLNALERMAYSNKSFCSQGDNEGGFYTKIFYGTGLQADTTGDSCTVILNTLHSLKGGMTGCKPGGDEEVQNYETFTKLHFSDGLKVQRMTSGCEYKITSPLPQLQGANSCGYFTEALSVFDKIVLGSGLEVQDDPGEYCDFKIDVGLYIQGGMTGCKPGGTKQVPNDKPYIKTVIGDGLKLAVAGCTATLTAPQPTISDDATTSEVFSNIEFGSGLHVYGPTPGNSCNYTVHSRLEFSDCEGTQVGSHRTEYVQVGDGLKLTAPGGNRIKLDLDKTQCSGAPVEVDVVRGITCVGSGFEVQIKTLRFTPEGLYIDSINR